MVSMGGKTPIFSFFRGDAGKIFPPAGKKSSLYTAAARLNWGSF